MFSFKSHDAELESNFVALGGDVSFSVFDIVYSFAAALIFTSRVPFCV